MSVHESELAKQIQAIERHAEMRCPEYDSGNICWSNVDKLLVE